MFQFKSDDHWPQGVVKCSDGLQSYPRLIKYDNDRSGSLQNKQYGTYPCCIPAASMQYVVRMIMMKIEVIIIIIIIIMETFHLFPI